MTNTLPDTPWHRIQPTRSFIDELLHNEAIRTACPDMERMIASVRLKVTELGFDDEAEATVALMGGDEDVLHAIVSYTHDLQDPDGLRAGNLYYEMNRVLRDRTPAGRAAMMANWGIAVHYLLKGLNMLPDVDGFVYRGFAHTGDEEKQRLLSHYRNGRPIQWGAFTSTSQGIEMARSFAASTATGVIFKIRIQSGKVSQRPHAGRWEHPMGAPDGSTQWEHPHAQLTTTGRARTLRRLTHVRSAPSRSQDIRPLSFFDEDEILLGPSHRFVVTSNNGGYADDHGFTTVDLQQMAGEWFSS